MSSGIKGDFSFEGQSFSGFGDGRFWAGGDGRTEILPSGTKRSKWNDYALKKGFRRRPINTFQGTRVSDGTTFTVQCDSEFSIAPMWLGDGLELKAQSRLVDKVRGHSFNLAVNAAQSRQLIDLTVGNLGKLGRSFLALKRGDFLQAARVLGAVPRPSKLQASQLSGRWLELQYGWLPLLSDTYEAAKAYEKITKKERKTTVYASAKESRDFDTYAGFGGGTSTGMFHTKKTQVCTVRIASELTEELSAPRSLGLQDPLSVFWEIIPYSFVVDWFVPIGTYLDNLAVIPFLKGRFMTTKAWVTTGCTMPTFDGTFPCLFGGEAVSSIQYPGYVDSGRGWFLYRTITGGLSVATPKFDATGLLHGNRIWNAIALATTRFI